MKTGMAPMNASLHRPAREFGAMAFSILDSGLRTYRSSALFDKFIFECHLRLKF